MWKEKGPASPEIQKKRDRMVLKFGNARMCVTKEGITLRVR